MAHVMEDEEQIKYYASKMALIELLYEFDINNSISADLINRFQQNNAEFFTQHSILHQQFRKLQIVSYLGHDEHNRELCEIACETSNPDLVQLAQLILSFNFMKKTNMLAQASDVHEHIKELLKLQKKENPKRITVRRRSPRSSRRLSSVLPTPCIPTLLVRRIRLWRKYAPSSMLRVACSTSVSTTRPTLSVA